MARKEFDRLLLDAVDEALSSMGESSRQAIYFHLEKSYNIKRDEIPRRIEDFAKAVEGIFCLGADFLEILIMKQLHKKIKGVFKWPESADFTFAEYIAVARRSFTEKENQEDSVQCEPMETQG